MGRLFLWTIPRSRSTAILRRLTSIPGVKGIFEPFCFAFHQHSFPHPFTWENLAEAMQRPPFTDDNVIWKDVPAVLSGEFDKWVPESYSHVILIREPRQVASSRVMVKGESICFMNYTKIVTYNPTMEQYYSSALELFKFLVQKELPVKIVDTSYMTDDDSGEKVMREITSFAKLPYSRCEWTSGEEHWWLNPNYCYLRGRSGHHIDFYGRALQSSHFMPRNETVDENVQIEDADSDTPSPLTPSIQIPKSLDEIDEAEMGAMLKVVQPMYAELLQYAVN